MSVQHAGLPKVSFLRERSPWVGRWGAWVNFCCHFEFGFGVFLSGFFLHTWLCRKIVILMQLSFVGGDKDNNILSRSSSSVYFGSDI